MKANELIVRCFAELERDQWQAFCLDFDLAAQADSFPEVKAKLNSMISEYVRDALVGPDQEYASQLLRRRAPLSLWLRYWITCAHARLRHAKDGLSYEQPVPMQPATC